HPTGNVDPAGPGDWRDRRARPGGGGGGLGDCPAAFLESLPPGCGQERPATAAPFSDYHFSQTDPGCPKCAEVRMSFAILRGRAVAHTIGQDCLEQFEFAPLKTHFLIDHHSREMLPDALTHDTGLAVIHRESFF